jgi:sugar O-acyltransferase (sialic acid O-acetyltransferase NeuD family)
LFTILANTIENMLKKKLIIIGASGHAKVVLDIFEKMNDREVIGFIDNQKQAGSYFLDYPILGNEEILSQHSAEDTALIIAIGDNWIRQEVRNRIKNTYPEFSFATGIHPSAQIGKAVGIGEGTVVMAGAVINSCCKIGEGCIINTRASLDHDGTMEDFSSVAPNVAAGGNVTIGTCASIGIGASIKHGIHIGAHAVVGGQSFVHTNISERGVAYGVPAKLIRLREIGEKYL